jgi:hypothetical protein
LKTGLFPVRVPQFHRFSARNSTFPAGASQAETGEAQLSVARWGTVPVHAADRVGCVFHGLDAFLADLNSYCAPKPQNYMQGIQSRTFFILAG